MTIAAANESFAVLGIAPTLDGGAVKRGYFAALQKHPPHADPEGFRRIREAYERLSRSDELFAAYMASSHDVDTALAEMDATIGQEISRTAEMRTHQQHDAAAKRAVVDALSRLSLSEALKAFGG